MIQKLMIAALSICLLAAPATAAKERGNRTKCGKITKKCVARIGNIGSSGCDGVTRTADHWAPTFEALLAEGDKEGAAKVGARVLKLTRHRGHVTVLKISATADTCVTKLRKACGDEADKFVDAVRAAQERAIADIEREQFIIDSFFDV